MHIKIDIKLILDFNSILTSYANRQYIYARIINISPLAHFIGVKERNEEMNIEINLRFYKENWC